jgi:ligand-binding sensor domain-containing protein
MISKRDILPIFLSKYAVLILLAITSSSNGQSMMDHINENKSQPINALFDVNQVINQVDTILTPDAPSRMTRKIRNDKDGNLIFASFTDIVRYDGKRFTKHQRDDGIDSYDAFDVLVDSKKNTWIASTHFGVFQYSDSVKLKSDSKTYNHLTTKNGLAHNRTMSLYEDRTGGIWIGTLGGISYYDGKTAFDGKISFHNFTQKDGLTNTSINTITEDSSGKIWVGTRGTVSIYDPLVNHIPGEKLFNEVKNNVGKPFENIWSIIEDRNGNIWLGGQFGLWRYDGNSYTHLTSVSTQYIYEDKKGIVWFTHGADAIHTVGLSYYDQESLFSNDLNATQVFSGGGMLWGISEDKNGDIWFGKLDGVLRYDGKSVSYFKDEILKDK